MRLHLPFLFLISQNNMQPHDHDKTQNIFKAYQQTMQGRTDKTELNTLQGSLWQLLQF